LAALEVDEVVIGGGRNAKELKRLADSSSGEV
jgi:hypothetical protein